jgi:glycosyltransferase involved in cell wall biosynthesis
MIKISIITVCYNSESTIIESLNSVINQFYPNIEFIVIDGGSTDSTLEILKKYISNIDILISEKDNGIYDAMNKGLKLASGDVVGFLNSDDIFLNNSSITQIAQVFNQNSEVGILYANLYYVKKNNVNKIIRYWKSKQYFINYFNFGNVPPHPTFYIKTNLIKNIGYFNLNFKLAADYEFMFRSLIKYKIKSYYLNEYIIKMRLGGATNKSLINIFKQNKEIYNAWVINNEKPPILLFPLRFLNKCLQFFYR